MSDLPLLLSRPWARAIATPAPGSIALTSLAISTVMGLGVSLGQPQSAQAQTHRPSLPLAAAATTHLGNNTFSTSYSLPRSQPRSLKDTYESLSPPLRSVLGLVGLGGFGLLAAFRPSAQRS